MLINWILLIVTLAAIEVLVLGMMVGRGRQKYGVPAPATTGDPRWERLNRVHQNSIEQLVLFVPLLVLYATNAGQPTAIIAGVVFLVARVIYAAGYLRDPARRGPGALLSFVVLWWLALGSVLGLVMKIVRT